MDESEFALIERLFAPLTSSEARGLRDDAACFTPSAGEDLIITNDALVSDVHYPKSASSELVAARLVAANASDLAACGALPRGCLLTLGVSDAWDMAWLEGFAQNLRMQLAHYQMPLWGGDTVRVSASFVALTAHGLVPHGTMLTRDGAMIGDDVYVSGVIGGAGLALAALASDDAPEASPFWHFYASPQARIELGVGLRGLAHAAIDVSDGLVADLDHICESSQCAIEISLDDIPFAASGCAREQQLALICAGDDYELAFTASPAQSVALVDLAARLDVPLVRIGRVISAREGGFGVAICDAEGHQYTLKTRGFRHF